MPQIMPRPRIVPACHPVGTMRTSDRIGAIVDATTAGESRLAVIDFRPVPVDVFCFAGHDII